MLTLTSLGGAGTVTGSKHLLTLGERRIMVDCGLFQGLKNLREQNWDPLPIPPQDIDAVVLTHAHLDHSGYLPRLIREGFRGPIFSTTGTRDVARLILLDSAHLQEKDAEYANRKGFSKHRPALPLYNVQDAERAMQAFRPIAFSTVAKLPGDAELTLRHAGHILGAATADISWGGRRIVFSGDLGRYGDPVMPDPEPVPLADHIVIESTYGNRSHDLTDPVQQLDAVIERTVKRGGTVVIPAFAVGRAQSLLYFLNQLKQSGRLPSIPVYLDSPMAISASTLLPAHMSEHRLTPEICRQIEHMVIVSPEVEDSKAITASPYPKIVISASGMATGGRVLHHLAAFAPDHRNTILFSGFQAAGTRGRAMLEGAREIRIHGQWVPVRAEVAELPSLSAHADANELMRWLGGFQKAPDRVFVVHGEPQASDTLRMRIGKELGWQATVPMQYQQFRL
ncbi:MAG TPA: MBL fold metallo-hydrolase [Eoetvoesiella sp.]|uniref:MBL fold metallo-hydrolase n=1 Tax=Eoetvoesiella sp. TaxID=1966355 RepID=UPI002BDF855E|nr:MBL fold metallo-hydrolase [Eoetvoesiella sp.]HWK59777.1 MBL fold metallo-hydrolase [Eoetvoesiella sp.]